VPVIATDIGGPSLAGILLAVGAAFALGTRVKTDLLVNERFHLPFDPDRKPRFLANPGASGGRLSSQSSVQQSMTTTMLAGRAAHPARFGRPAVPADAARVR
jgi:enediyne polyketide synthase